MSSDCGSTGDFAGSLIVGPLGERVARLGGKDKVRGIRTRVENPNPAEANDGLRGEIRGDVGTPNIVGHLGGVCIGICEQLYWRVALIVDGLRYFVLDCVHGGVANRGHVATVDVRPLNAWCAA